MTFLKTSIEYLKGVGTARAELLKKELGIFTFADLLFHFPYRHVDRSQIYKISDINGEMPYIQLKGKISNFKTIGKNKGQRLVANLSDETEKLELVWFQGAKWIRDSIKENKEYMVFGKPTEFNGSINIAHPVIDDPENFEQKKYLRIMPFYTVTERMRTLGLDTKAMMKLTNNLLNDPKFFVEENLPAAIISEQKIIARKDALLQIHFPESPEKLKLAENRLKFEELLFIQLRLLRYKLKRTQLFNGIKFEKIGEIFNSFYETKLPFKLTDAQKRVIKEIRNDVKSGRQMNRLLQGDVGSGKTVVALMCMLMAMDNGFQSCMMVPTEILAQQHFKSITSLLGEMNVKVKLLTGSSSTKERKIILEGLLNSEINILIGTHAVIEKIVQFNNLGFVVIDEQHRFGVEQRSALWKKNSPDSERAGIHPPHMLVMTATPIPRTLAMTLYGDLDVSVIDELPPGRKPVRTEHRFDSNRLRVIGFMKEQIAKGRQIYIVYPLIEESEKLDFMNLMAGYENISRDFPQPQYQVSMVHGKMKPKDKEFEMQRFVRGETNIMVATTVIEVGVDVPNASVMIIENAERFGLSQLHQLRGRVGRGAEQSFCILMTSFKLSADGKKRIATMCKTNDGFEIAEVDLKLRGPGELEGTQQSGVLDLRIADIAKDQIILMNARDVAQKILNSDPNLIKPENSQLLNYFTEYSKHNKWGMIS